MNDVIEDMDEQTMKCTQVVRQTWCDHNVFMHLKKNSFNFCPWNSLNQQEIWKRMLIVTTNRL